jgi:hypothetical protein
MVYKVFHSSITNPLTPSFCLVIDEKFASSKSEARALTEKWIKDHVWRTMIDKIEEVKNEQTKEYDSNTDIDPC